MWETGRGMIEIILSMEMSEKYFNYGEEREYE